MKRNVMYSRRERPFWEDNVLETFSNDTLHYVYFEQSLNLLKKSLDTCNWTWGCPVYFLSRVSQCSDIPLRAGDDDDEEEDGVAHVASSRFEDYWRHCRKKIHKVPGRQQMRLSKIKSAHLSQFQIFTMKVCEFVMFYLLCTNEPVVYEVHTRKQEQFKYWIPELFWLIMLNRHPCRYDNSLIRTCPINIQKWKPMSFAICPPG